MIATQHTQSLTDFRQNANLTLDRLNQTGEAEILTVNGEARAILLSPAAFDALARDAQLTRDVAVMRKAMKEISAGKGLDVDEAFGSLRVELESKKTSTRRGIRK